LEERIWSLTSPRKKCISASRNFCALPQKDFCNSIAPKAEIADGRRHVREVPTRRHRSLFDDLIGAADQRWKAKAPWKPGECGNPAGRPLGSRNKLSESVIQDIAADWAVGGAETIARVRMTDPATYFSVVVSILPKDVLASVQQQTPGNLAPEEWATMVELVRLIKASAFGTSGGSEHLVGAGGASVAMLVTAPQISAR